jgi:hypothetical protein
VKVSGKTEIVPDEPGKDAPNSGPVLFEWALKKFETKARHSDAAKGS